MTANRFDICEAYYIYSMQYHESGQTARDIRLNRNIMGQLSHMKFKPSPMLRDENDLTEEGLAIYKMLLDKWESPAYNKDGTPYHVVCFDNGGETADRYTVLFTGQYTHLTGGVSLGLGMNATPFHPQGIGMHFEIFGEYETGIDYVEEDFGHWGEIIPFSSLPEDCKRAVMNDYIDIWGVK